MTEGHSLLRPGQRRFERTLRNPRSLRGDADAPAIERRERHLVAFTFVADPITGRYFAVGEDQFATSRGINPQLLFLFAHLEPGRAFLDHDRGDSFFALRRVSINVDDRRVGRPAIGDPRLSSVDNVLVALFDSSRLQGRGVRASLWFRQRVTADLFSARKRKKEFLLLLFIAETMNRIAIKRILNGENHAGRRAAPGNFFDRHTVGDMIESRPTFGLRQRNPSEAKLSRL